MIRKYGRMTGARVRAAIVAGAVMVPLVASGQIRFERTYGGPDDDVAFSVKQTADGGYVIAGYSWSFSGGEEDVYLIKTDEYGDTLWTRSFGGPWEDTGRAVDLTEDGGYIVAGRTRSFDHGYEDVYLIKTDSGGDSIWTRAHGRSYSDGAYSVEQTSDGGYIATGVTLWDLYLVKANAAGDTIWTRGYGGWGDRRGHSVKETSDGCYIIVGQIYYWDWYYSYYHVLMMKTDDAGDSLWTRSYYADQDGKNIGWCVAETVDGGYIIAGDTGTHLYVVRTDGQGDTLWTRKYGGPGDDRGRSIIRTGDGGYAIAGHTQSFGAGGWDFYLIKTDAAGETLWTRTYGGTEDDVGWSVDQTSDGGYVIGGYTQSFGAGGWDVYMIKTDANGYVQVSKQEDDSIQQRGLYLGQSHPNPFRATATIPYTLSSERQVRLAIYDVRGALVRELVSGVVPAGRHEAVWDGRNGRGHEVGSGVYFCHLKAGDHAETKRMVLLR